MLYAYTPSLMKTSQGQKVKKFNLIYTQVCLKLSYQLKIASMAVWPIIYLFICLHFQIYYYLVKKYVTCHLFSHSSDVTKQLCHPTLITGTILTTVSCDGGRIHTVLHRMSVCAARCISLNIFLTKGFDKGGFIVITLLSQRCIWIHSQQPW